MTRQRIFRVLALFQCLVMSRACSEGFTETDDDCIDYNECEHKGICGANSVCTNTNGSYYCRCADGYKSSTNEPTFTSLSSECQLINKCLHDSHECPPNSKCINAIATYLCSCGKGFKSSTGKKMFHHNESVTCEDDNECHNEMLCGSNATCINTQGSYKCVCNNGFGLKSGRSSFTGKQEQCHEICMINDTICGKGTCHVGPDGFYCECPPGFTNFGNKKLNCTALDCNISINDLDQQFPSVLDYFAQLARNCRAFTKSEATKSEDGDDLIKELMLMIDNLLASEDFSDRGKLSLFLDLVEEALRIIGPFIEPPGTERTSAKTDMKMLVHKGSALPQGLSTLASKHAKLDIDLAVAAGDPSNYPGFAAVSLLSYSNLEEFANGYFDGIPSTKNQSYKINSKVVTVTVSNRNTSQLEKPIKLTLSHLEKTNATSHTCVFWDSSMDGGSWSTRGCDVVEANPAFTICSCHHLSSFAVLMALYEIEDTSELQLITWVGLSLSLICLFICILTFSTIRSIQSPRTSIHLHLCISLFVAIFVFLVGISQTRNRVLCGLVAGMLHYFFLSAFCWMCLEGIQLFRMVVLVFNTGFKTLYMVAGGYGVPAVIVVISALVNYKGYGSERNCWLGLDLMWSFFGPVVVIVLINIFFFLITAWKLAQKFSSLNPDLDSIQKIKAYTITAVAQLSLLGTMWIFGCFQFDKSTIVMSYLFTIFASLQGVMLFILHCLFSKQVRDEYRNILSRLLTSRQKTYSEFSNSHSSKRQLSKGTQDTRESQI